MALLVAFGLMNLAAMVVLAAIVLVEKTSLWGPPQPGRRPRRPPFAVVVIFLPGTRPASTSRLPWATWGGCDG